MASTALNKQIPTRLFKVLANRRILVAGNISTAAGFPHGSLRNLGSYTSSPYRAYSRIQATTLHLIQNYPCSPLTCLPHQDLEREIRSSKMTEPQAKTQVHLEER